MEAHAISLFYFCERKREAEENARIGPDFFFSVSMHQGLKSPVRPEPGPGRAGLFHFFTGRAGPGLKI